MKSNTLAMTMAVSVFLLRAGGCGPSAANSSSNTPDNPPGGESGESGDHAAEGNLADLALEKTDGSGVVHLRSLARGKVMIIAFWATWCDSCKPELVGLKGLYEEYGNKGIEVVAISVDTPDTAGEVQSEVHRIGIPFTSLIDTESQASSSLNQTGTAPFTVIVDKSMNVIFSHEGFLAGDLDKFKKIAVEALGK
ncbi:MAG: TlpA disulfide reductase family protein [Pseudomonadota bacterium]